MLQESISSRVTNFSIDEGKEDVYATTKVSQLSRIAMDLRKQVEELKAQQQSITPLEVIKQCRKTIFEAIDKIREGNKLCTEEIATFYVAQEIILEYEIDAPNWAKNNIG